MEGVTSSRRSRAFALKPSSDRRESLHIDAGSRISGQVEDVALVRFRLQFLRAIAQPGLVEERKATRAGLGKRHPLQIGCEIGKQQDGRSIQRRTKAGNAFGRGCFDRDPHAVRQLREPGQDMRQRSRPTGFDGLPPPGPAIPVMATAISACEASSAPRAIAHAVATLTAPSHILAWLSITPLGRPVEPLV